MTFLIIDGYSEKSRAGLADAGMSYAWQLYAALLKKYMPYAEYRVFFPSDAGAEFPDKHDLAQYDGIMWTGADLCINDTHIPSIAAQITLARQAYEIGIPSCGSCWGIQMAAVAAGGTVITNPKGREMNIGRKIHLTEAGKNHPMTRGKPTVYDGFESHYDVVSEVPEGGTVLAVNSFSGVQAISVTHKKGTFWGTQYHPEYNLHEMARLIVAREQVLTEQGFFTGQEDMKLLVDRMERLHASPDRKDLAWQLGIESDILDPAVREQEYANWIYHLVIPNYQAHK